MKFSKKVMWKCHKGASNSAWEDLGGFREVILELCLEAKQKRQKGSSREKAQLVHKREVQ